MNILTLHQRFRRYCTIEEGLALTTVQCFKRTIRTFVKRTGVENVSDITLEVLRDFFYEGKEKYQWSYWHYINYHKYLKKFMGWCVEQGHVQSNPVLQIKKPKRPQVLPRRLSEQEGLKVLMEAFNYEWRYDFERTRNHAIIATFLYSGIRSKELLNLEITDINLNTGTILIRSGKGNKDRYVPVYTKLRYILKRYLTDRKRAGKKSMYLFTGAQNDKPLSYKAIHKICKKISRSSGIHFTPHCLRHTFASVAVEKNVNLMHVKEILGHSSISSTMIYLKMSAQALSRGLNAVDMF